MIAHDSSAGYSDTLPVRYAIYFIPPPVSALYRFGSQWLGYDCYGARPLAPTQLPGIDPKTAARLTEEPRIYGFHGTLKAPFALAADKTAAELTVALDAFAATAHRCDVPVQVCILGSFVAIVPTRPSASLDGLASELVQSFDRFRAPLQDAERQRRLAHPLTPRQRDYLERWGYPYVLDDFRFHMTLTGRLADGEQYVAAELARAFASRHGDTSINVDRIVLSCQHEPGQPFRVVHSALLGGRSG